MNHIARRLLSVVLLAQVSRAAETNLVRNLNTPRTFPAVASRAAWEQRAQEIREQVLVSCGLWPMPEKTPLHPQVFGKIEREGYSIERVYFQPSPGFYLAGNLYRPVGKGRGPFPGVLLPHGHWTEGRLVDSADASVPALGISFARQGMVAFAYDMVGYNDTRFAGSSTNVPAYNTNRMFGTNRTDELWNISLMGLQTWNSIRALDFLESLPGVDKKRLACTGPSGGGTQTFMLGAVDDRLAAQAPICMVSSTMQGGCSCENAPGLRVEYSNMEIAAAAAPRPQILIAATGDWTKMTLEVEGPAVGKIYELLGAKDRLRYTRFDFGHNYNQTSREAVYDWFGRWLLKHPDPASLKEQPFGREPVADLRVFPDGKLPAGAVTKDQFSESLKRARREQWRKLVPKDKSSFKKFREVMLPAWRHTLQFSPVLAGGDGGSAVGTVLTRVGGGADDGEGLKLIANSNPLVKLSNSQITCKPVAAASAEHTNFFSTYNRTLAQENCRQIISGCIWDHEARHTKVKILLGTAQTGLWVLLAAPAADVVIANCGARDVSTDEALLAPGVFCPGLRTIGGFQGAAMLAAPHPLLLHNVGEKFPTDDIRAAYRALGASDKLRIETKQLSDEEIAAWISKVK
ncbi:MAG: hypothetical protein EXS35_13530 [Pedosphaera sp.]|nr:hypothetical protein [Pedosphaera sp.]